MIVGAATERPVILALTFLDRQIVDACDPQLHQSVLVELPVLVSVAAEPVPAVVVPFIGKSHCNAVFAKGPDFFDQTIVELAIPLACQECFDRLAAMQKLRAIAPPAVGRVGERNACRFTGIPGILGHARLLCGGLSVERGKWRSIHLQAPPKCLIGWKALSACSAVFASCGVAGDPLRTEVPASVMQTFSAESI